MELFAESADPSDDDDMIGYDVGLGPHSLAPVAAGAGPPSAAETPSDCCNGC